MRMAGPRSEDVVFLSWGKHSCLPRPVFQCFRGNGKQECLPHATRSQPLCVRLGIARGSGIGKLLRRRFLFYVRAAAIIRLQRMDQHDGAFIGGWHVFNNHEPGGLDPLLVFIA